MEKLKELIQLIGKNKKVFTRLLMLVGLIVAGVILIQNVSCGYNKSAGFWFKWLPAAKIEVKKEL